MESIQKDILNINNENNTLLDNKDEKNKSNINEINDKINTDSDGKSIVSEYEDNYHIKIENIKNQYYPINPYSINAYTFYYDIHKYILSKDINMKKPIYPSYFAEYSDDIINNKKNILGI